MSYVPNYNQYNDARMGSRGGPPSRPAQEQRYANPSAGRGGGYGYQQPYNTVSVAPMPVPQVPVALPNGAAMPVFPPHPDTKPRVMQQPAPMMMHQYQQRMNIQELVLVPPELAAFASDPQFQQILLKVKEQTMINFISLNRTSTDSVESIAIDAPSRESAQLARGLIETHFKLQSKLKAAETRLQKVQTDLFSAQGEIASGMMIEFTIDPELVGLALGKKGARIKQIEAETKVTSINVTGETGRIMIVGPDNQSVQRAREMLELQEECIPLESHQIDWLSNKYNSGMLNDIKTGSDLIVTRVNSEKFTLDIVGTVAAVRSARFMLPTQMEYVAKQIEIEANERQARDKLQQVRKQYGLNRGYDRDEHRESRGGDRADRGDRNNDNRGDRNDRDRNRGGNGNNAAGGSSRTNGQDSLVNLGGQGNNRDNTKDNNRDRDSNKKAASTPQDVAAAYAKATKKPTTNANTPATKTIEPVAAKNNNNGNDSAKKGSSGRTVEAQAVPMLQQVTARASDKKQSNNAGGNTKSNNDDNKVAGLDNITSGVKNMKVEPASAQKTNNGGGAQNKKASESPAPKDTSKDNKGQQKQAAAAPATPIVYQDQDALPQRSNNRNNRKKADSAAPATATPAAGAAASPPGLAPTTTEVPAGDKTQGSNRRRGGKKSDGAADAGAAAGASSQQAASAESKAADTKADAAGAGAKGAAAAAGAGKPKSGRGRGGRSNANKGEAGAAAAAPATESA